MMIASQVDAFFAYAIERQSILLKRRSGKPKPWTDDPILQSYRFCNIFREDDVVTKWVKENIRDVYAEGDLIFNLIAARLFNLPSTLQILIDHGVMDKWDINRAKRAMFHVEGPTVNAAYIVIGQPGFGKGHGICETLNLIHPERHRMFSDITAHNTLEDATRILGEPNRMGAFLGYEVACDLRYTPVLHKARDRMTWANPGPGAARGLSKMIGEHKHHFNRGSKTDRAVMLSLMQELLKESRTRWPWKKWEMREVEHTLCEFDKYTRVLMGEGRPKQRYDGLAI